MFDLFSISICIVDLKMDKPEASSSFISISNSAVMRETSFEGDLRPLRRLFEESHLRLTNVT